MELVGNKGMIVDYSLEDARALHQREQRLEKQKKISLEKKKEQKKEAKKETKQEIIPGVVDLGKKGKEDKAKEAKPSIDKITDLELLHRLLRETHSRGKKQRIKKRIAHLKNPNGE